MFLNFQSGRKIFFRIFLKISFAHKKLKNHLKKLLTYGSWEVFFSLCSPNRPKHHFRFINSFIQPSRVGSLLASCCYWMDLYVLGFSTYISQDMNSKFLEILFLFKLKVVHEQDALKSIIFSRKAQFSEFSWV